MPDGIAVVRDGHKTWLKWHRARKRAGDLPFTGERILEGMRLGASVEVDLVKHAEGGFAVLHDESLEPGTTGSGLVAARTRSQLRQLYLRDEAGNETTHHVMLLEDLMALLGEGGLEEGALLQLDLKEGAAALGRLEIAGFAEAVSPLARHMILSAGDATAVALLTDAVPELKVGYDPCHEGAIERLVESRDFDGFVRDAVAASPRAEMIYLEQRLVLFAAQQKYDLVAAFHAAGRRIDAYTLETTAPAMVEIAEQLLALEVDQITTDDAVGLELALNPSTSQG